MFSIKKYLNFNSAHATDVKLLEPDEKLSAASCHYHKRDHSIFFIEAPTFTYVVNGNKYMIIDNKEFFLAPGDLLFIPKNSVVFTYIPQQAHGFESMNMVLSNSALKNSAGLLSSINEPVLINTAVLKTQKPALEQHFERFKKSLGNLALSDAEKKAACINFLYGISGQGKSSAGMVNPLKEPAAEEIEKIKAVLLENLYKPASVPDIAAQCNMSVSTFKRKFELLFGVPPKTWKRTICLQTAYFNLKTGNYKVSDMPDFVGFESFSHFSQAFKKQFKLSPSVIAGNKLN